MVGYHLLSTRPSTAPVLDPNPTSLSVRRPTGLSSITMSEEADAASCELDVMIIWAALTQCIDVGSRTEAVLSVFITARCGPA